MRIVLIIAGGLLAGCPVAAPDPAEALQRQVLAAYVTNVARPTVERFATDATALREAVEAWQRATPAQQGDATTTARAKLEAATLSWQRVELLQVGPLGAATRVRLGEGLRDEVDSWPTTNLCRVDVALVANTTPDDAYFDTALVTSKGLPVLEELLHRPAGTSACPATATIMTDGSWAALAATPALAERERAWAAGVARHVERTAKRVRDGWSGEGSFGEKLLAAGGAGSPWRSPMDALEDVFTALFFVDLDVKDDKLARPLGLTMECMTTVCPQLAESPRALLSSRALVENLTAARAVFTGAFEAGSTAAGFDDLLVDRGAGSLKDEMLASLDLALTRSRALDRPIQNLVVDAPASVVDVRNAVKAFTDALKLQFVTTLSLTVPKEGAGDND